MASDHVSHAPVSADFVFAKLCSLAGTAGGKGTTRSTANAVFSQIIKQHFSYGLEILLIVVGSKKIIVLNLNLDTHADFETVLSYLNLLPVISSQYCGKHNFLVHVYHNANKALARM